MIFTAERPITAQHVRDVCARFNEGLRVEYKRALDANVRNHLPKIISSFANSQGGVLVVGINTLNGVPQPPFDGFAFQPREEFPLTVENICLQNINPPVLPRTHVIESDVPNQVFLVIEVDESGEAPHAIENSRMVYVRTGNAANPYDLAEVDLIIDLLKRRREPLEHRDRLIEFAERRSNQSVHRDRPFLQISICPTFPRTALCTTQQVWEFMFRGPYNQAASLFNLNTVKRIPDGAADWMHHNADNPLSPAQYAEIGNYGLLFAAREFQVIPWAGGADQPRQIWFADLIQTLVKLIVFAERFYANYAYLGGLLLNTWLHNVQGFPMRFLDAPPFGDDPDDFRCHTEVVSTERLTAVEQIRTQRPNVLTEILTELTWSFWQSNAQFPVARLRQMVDRTIQAMRV